ncbi:MAG: hypothetical protein NVSMB19_00190 [Vulcanimicrobiaceae bacterium]
MALSSRRVEISFDREREAFRGLFEAVTIFRRTSQLPESACLEPPAARRTSQDDLRLADPAAPEKRSQPLSKAGRYLATLAQTYGPLSTTALADDVPFVDTLILDASALTALAGGNARARAHVTRAVGSLARILVPATVLRDGTLQRIADALADVVPTDSAQARLAATLLVAAPDADPYDALTVALAAQAERGAVLTTHSRTIERLVRATTRRDLYAFSV